MKNEIVHRIYAVCNTGYNQSLDDKDCAVRAIANALKIEYQESFDLLKKYGRKAGEGTTPSTIHNALKEFPNVSIFGAFGGKNEFVHRRYGMKQGEIKVYHGTSVKSFAKARPKGTYIVLTTTHVLVVRDGEIVGNKYERVRSHVDIVYQVN